MRPRLLASLLCLLLPVSAISATPTPLLKVSAEQERALGLRVARAEAATQILIRHLPGNVAAQLGLSGMVTVPLSGVVTRVLRMEGETVAAGTPLAIVQSSELLQLGAKAQRAGAEAALAAQRAQRDQALLDEGVIARARVEESRARQQQAEADLSEARQQMALAPRGNAQAGQYELRSPLAGRVLRRDVLPGDAVAAGSHAFLIGDDRELDVALRVPVTAATRLRPGAEVRLSSDPAVRGRVLAVAAATERGNQTVPVRARFGADSGLLVGQQVAVDIALPAAAGALAIPQSAVVRQADVAYVFVRAPGGFRAVPVQVLGDAANGAVVTGAIAVGSEIAISATTTLMAILAAE